MMGPFIVIIKGSDHKTNKLLEELIGKVDKLMSQITDWAAKEQANLDAISGVLDNIVAGIANLDALIVAFQNSPGTLSASDQAALDAIVASSGNLVTKSQAISTTAPTAPTPPA